MSKSNSSPHRIPPYKRPIVIISFLLLLLLATVVTVLIFKNFHPSPSLTPVEPSQPEPSNPVGDDPVQEPIDAPDSKPSPYEGEDPNLRNELTGRISYKNVDYASNQLIAIASIDQYLVNGGDCQLQLISGESILASLSLAATPDVSTSVCGPFNLSLNGVPQGTYQIRILVSSNDRRGTIIDQIDI